MYTKIEIIGTIKIETGLHIGGSTAFAAIGAVDSPVIRDTLSGLPIIPGTSLKGKMRTLLSRSMGQMVKNPEDDGEEICRLFGSKKVRGRLLFSDSILGNEESLKNMGLYSTTEVKFENGINRLSGVANPRQIERVIRGTEFPLNLIYNVEDQDELLEDMQTIADGLKLLEYDYLGGSGSRGYGKVTFQNIEIRVVVGSLQAAQLQECTDVFCEYLKEV